MTQLREVLRFELRLHLKRLSTWFFFVLLLALAALFTLAFRGDMGTNANAPSAVALYAFVLGFFGVLVTAALFADAGHRDVQYRMIPLFFSTPLEKRDYLLGRYAGAFIVNAIVLLAIPVGLLLASLIPGVDPSLTGPFTVETFVRPYLLFVLPGLLINSAVLFSIAVLGKRALSTYLGVVGLYLFYGGAVAITSEVMHRSTGALLDPTGMTAVLELLRDWSPGEKNTQQIPLAGRLLVNRILWISIALGMLAFTFVRFRLSLVHGSRQSVRGGDDGDVEAVAHVSPVTAPRVVADYGNRAQMQQMLSIARRFTREILAGRDFRAVIALLLLAVIGFGWGGIYDQFGSPVYPVTSVVARFLAGGIFAVAIPLITVFYAGELVWRERDLRLADIVDAAPSADWVTLAGKMLALIAMLFIMQTVVLIGGVMLQALQGYFRFEPLLFVQILFGIKLVDYLLFAVAAVLIHALLNNKYVAHLVAVLLLLVTRFIGMFGYRNHLVVYGTDAGWVHSDLSGFGPFLEGYAWTKLYWLSWASLFLILSMLVWVRGRETSARMRARTLRARWGPVVASMAVVSLIVIAGTGGYIYYNSRVLNEYLTAEQAEQRHAEYERRYRHLDDVPQPTISRVQVRAELYPERRRVEVTGTYVLTNLTAVPIESVHVSMQPFYDLKAASFNRGSSQLLADEAHRFWIYRLDKPLAPGDSVHMNFELEYAPRGFSLDGVNTTVVSNGTYVERHVMPVIGYQRSLELENEIARRRHALSPRVPFPPPTDSAARYHGLRRAQYDAIVGTSASQIPVAPGTLVKTWIENGRRYVQHTSGTPMTPNFGYQSGRYAVREDTVDGVRVQLLHHPSHDWNVDRIMHAARRALSYYTRNFGPNPYREVRIVEFPRYATKATASPNLIAVSESFGFLTKIRDDASDNDTPLLVTAHEIAHQWWGGQLSPAITRGGQVLTESLANYSALMVLEDTHGRDAVTNFLYTQQIEYLNRRANGDLPLFMSSDNSNVHYRKGALAMYALRNYLGEDAVNKALQSLLAKFRFKSAPYATSVDLVAEIRAVAPDSLQYLVTDMMETITVWDLVARRVTVDSLDGGSYNVTLQLDAAKFRVDTAYSVRGAGDSLTSADTHHEIPVDDFVEIGVFGDSAGKQVELYLAKHRITPDTKHITVTVRGKPVRAGIDPYHVLIARRGDDLADNVRDVDR